MKIWQDTAINAAQVPLLQEPLAPEQLPADVLKSLDERLHERAQLESMADRLLARLQPRIEALAVEAVREDVRDAWQQRYPLQGQS